MYSLPFSLLAQSVPRTNDAFRAAFLGVQKRGPDWWVVEMARTQSRLNGSPDPSLPAHAGNAHFVRFIWNFILFQVVESFRVRWLRRDELQFVFQKDNLFLNCAIHSAECCSMEKGMS